jgi:multiple sugar transport system ATP-binding protein
VAGVRLEKVGKAYGETRVLSGLDLDVASGEFLVLVGPSGCGKSTALRLIAGLDEPTEGTISIGDRIVNGVPPRERDIAMVFQSYALYPHMTVRENLSFGLEMRKVPRPEAEARLRDAAEYLGLTPYLDRTPRELSGGQRQRVALGRALVRRPKVFLFDEPLSNLDAALRVQMRAELAKLQERYKTTSIYVTHDQVEAMTLGHRIAVLRDGVLQQVGAPLDVYRNPENLFVAGFLGTPAINRLEARVEEAGATLAGDGFVLPVPPGLRSVTASRAGSRVVVGLRAEHLYDESAPGRASLRVRVTMVEPLGHEVIVHGRVGELPGTPVSARLAGPRAPGSLLEVHADIAALLLFDAETGRRLAAA